MKTINITRMPANYIGDTDGDVLFSEEILKSIPAAAKHWDEHNDKNLWAKERFHNEKYVAVACIGDEHDYAYEEVGYTNHWKEARKYYFMGADVYRGNERVHFIDHKEVDDAFQTLKKHYFMMASTYYWEDSIGFEDEVRIKDAQDVLDKNGFKLEPDFWPNEEWQEKMLKRKHVIADPLAKPFCERNPKAVPVYVADTHKLVRVESSRCEDDELPF